MTGMERPKPCERPDCGILNDTRSDEYKTGDGLTVVFERCMVCGKQWPTYIEKPPFPSESHGQRDRG